MLVGATAASLGDRLSSPFTHHTDVQANQHGSLMPGVEVLANALNTILRSRFYSETPGWVAFLWAATTAALTLALLALSQGRFAYLRELSALAGVAGALALASYVAFTRFLIIPPVTPGLVSFASAGLLGLLRRSFVTSSRLDASIAEMAQAGDLLAPADISSASAASVARLTDAAAVAIFAAQGGERYRLIGAYGVQVLPRFSTERPATISFDSPTPSQFFAFPAGADGKHQLLEEPLNTRTASGKLVIAYAAERPPSSEALRVSAAIASNAVRVARAPEERAIPPWRWPRGLEGKARTLGRLNATMIEHSRFVDLALRSVEDGLIIAGPDGRITFANPRAAAILQSGDQALIGKNLLERLAECEQGSGDDGATAHRDMLARLLLDRAPIEREITLRGQRPRQYILRLAAVSADNDRSGPASGMVASLSDITRQQELHQTKNDVISLVSHEMRTPLTAIQGMSEVLATYELDPERRREMNLAINDEVKRLTRMITEYLDITRLESGATVLRRSAMRLESLLDRTLLLLEPLAAQKRIRLTRVFARNLPALLADPDLLSRAVENLVSNAIKYSPPDTEVMVSVRATEGEFVIEVEDQGFGLSAADLGRIFEKFYRVPRVQDVDVPGTGLGLALVREIAELHGGSVTVKSELNAGSTFLLQIPAGDVIGTNGKD